MKANFLTTLLLARQLLLCLLPQLAVLRSREKGRGQPLVPGLLVVPGLTPSMLLNSSLLLACSPPFKGRDRFPLKLF